MINEVQHYGFFPSSQVEKYNGEKFTYLFTPSPKFDLDPNKGVFERARLIVACLRHGQYHAKISKIKYPKLILDKMINNELKSHSYADQ
ncbi:MAG: hypothetical protein ACPKQO_00425 [Nitrososphaeraceae archaeon]